MVAAADGGPARFAEAMAAATMELERSAAALADMGELAVVESDGGMQPAEASPLSFLERATSDLATTRRALEQGGEVPAHFLTLTTAIYHWDDLRTILQEYDQCTTLLRDGRRDPLEPGEEILPEAKRLVQAYPGVVAWYCGLKLELYATCVLDYNDVFGVYEWGAGGIVHLHCRRGPRVTAATTRSTGSRRRRAPADRLCALRAATIRFWPSGT